MSTSAYRIDLPAEQQALKIESAGILSLRTTQLPYFGQDQVLVRVSNVGLNPVDAKSADLSPSEGATSGVDFTGEVVAVGSALRRPLNIGDRVFGCVFGNNPDEKDNGAFAQYLAAYADLVWKVPDAMSMESASCLGVGLVTVGLALFYEMGLVLPDLAAITRDEHNDSRNDESKQDYVLVYGAATATGTLALQALRM
jgi:aspyridone synthetase trans-acting enoyl reductase